jgi:hypothetical protein
MDTSPPTPTELDTYTHVFFTSGTEWNPQSIDDDYTANDLDLIYNDNLYP